jgi:hypothetical protein
VLSHLWSEDTSTLHHYPASAFVRDEMAAVAEVTAVAKMTVVAEAIAVLKMTVVAEVTDVLEITAVPERVPEEWQVAVE